MGIKGLWSILTPYCDRKPINELKGKVVAIDLAGWICESLNTVDYFVHPRNHLKNLFYRTCYLVWEEITPVFVLEGDAPSLKNSVISERKEKLFRGVKPKDKKYEPPAKAEGKRRSRFDHMLRQCEMLLKCLGISCVKAPGEAEAYCAFLNKKGLVDGVISQDSDCFAYGAVRVYRNFSVSTQGAASSIGGSVDIYDMNQIKESIDIGQHKIIVMALLCGCDYSPDGIVGIGRDGVLKLFNKYGDHEILDKIRSWRQEDSKYTELELRVDDKTICTNCGHIGRIQQHLKSGCNSCKTLCGCDETLWRNQRINIKNEIMLRKKALSNSSFPFENIIKEFLFEPGSMPSLCLTWCQPNVVKFIRKIGPLLQWSEIYSFQKMFPLLTRWQLRNVSLLKEKSALSLVVPEEIKKVRTLKGVQSLEVYWNDVCDVFKGLIPHEQLTEFSKDNENCFQKLWTTVEPLSLMEQAHTDLVSKFLITNKRFAKTKVLKNTKQLMPVNEIKAVAEPVRDKKNTARIDVKLIDKYFHKMHSAAACSSPVMASASFDLEENDSVLDLSDVVKGITRKKIVSTDLIKFNGKALNFESTELTDSTVDLNLQKTQTDENDMSLDDGTLDRNASYFFNNTTPIDYYDQFEKIMDINFSGCNINNCDI